MRPLLKLSKILRGKKANWHMLPNLLWYSTDKKKNLWEFQYYQEGVGRGPPGKIEDRETSNLPVEIGIFLRKDVDLSFQGMKRLWKKFNENVEKHSQRYIPERQQKYGPELGAAHFAISCGGSVKFYGNDKWYSNKKDSKFTLPTSFVDGVSLEAVDFQDTEIMYEGLVNIATARKVKWMSFRNCPYVDDWFLDNLIQFKDSLEYLDISDCADVTERGVCVLHRLRNLKTLKLENLPNIQYPELVCILLEDVLLDIKIEGISYMNK